MKWASGKILECAVWSVMIQCCVVSVIVSCFYVFYLFCSCRLLMILSSFILLTCINLSHTAKFSIFSTKTIIPNFHFSIIDYKYFFTFSGTHSWFLGGVDPGTTIAFFFEVTNTAATPLPAHKRRYVRALLTFFFT